MNKKLKKALKSAFEAPLPLQKEQFLKELKYPTRTYQSFLLSQFFYIRKRIWVVSLLVVVFGIALLQINMKSKWNDNLWEYWSVSSMIPFFALIIVLEIYRSSAYHMAELEGTFRFNLAEIIVARLIILGVISFFVLFLLIVFGTPIFVNKSLSVVVYIMVPYLVVCGLSLGILNHKNSTEGVYGCVAVACFVSLIGAIPSLYRDTYLMNWIIAFLFSSFFIIWQLRNLLKQTEGQSWNLIFGK